MVTKGGVETGKPLLGIAKRLRDVTKALRIREDQCLPLSGAPARLLPCLLNLPFLPQRPPRGFSTSP